MDDDLLREFGSATHEEIQRAHDLLHAMVVGEIPAPALQANVRLIHAVHDALSWVLGFPCGEHFRVTISTMAGVLKRNGVTAWPSHPPA